jgi:hypothetical protein
MKNPIKSILITIAGIAGLLLMSSNVLDTKEETIHTQILDVERQLWAFEEYQRIEKLLFSDSSAYALDLVTDSKNREVIEPLVYALIDLHETLYILSDEMEGFSWYVMQENLTNGVK